jgi:hypothetical protein
MTTETPPDWVLLEAAKLCGYTEIWCNANFIHRHFYPNDKTFRALCDMIAKHEKKPLDRKLLCAEQATDEASIARADVVWTVEDIAVRAIELWEEGFGK